MHFSAFSILTNIKQGHHDALHIFILHFSNNIEKKKAEVSLVSLQVLTDNGYVLLIFIPYIFRENII